MRVATCWGQTDRCRTGLGSDEKRSFGLDGCWTVRSWAPEKWSQKTASNSFNKKDCRENLNISLECPWTRPFKMLCRCFQFLNFWRRSAAASQVRLWDVGLIDRTGFLRGRSWSPHRRKAAHWRGPAKKTYLWFILFILSYSFHHQSGCCMLRMFFSFHLRNYVVSKVSLPQHLP